MWSDLLTRLKMGNGVQNSGEVPFLLREGILGWLCECYWLGCLFFFWSILGRHCMYTHPRDGIGVFVYNHTFIGWDQAFCRLRYVAYGLR